MGNSYADQPLPDLSYSHSSSLGDVKLIGSYQGFLPGHNLGVELGVKLPTGHYGTAVNFSSGPKAGMPLDASLQPGTGSTDVIVGAYYYRPISENFDVTVNAQFQSAVKQNMDQPGNDFRPGNSLNFSVGLRYEAHPNWVPQLQLNLLAQERRPGGARGRAGHGGHGFLLESRTRRCARRRGCRCTVLHSCRSTATWMAISCSRGTRSA